jgi:hypothetical protein
MNNQSLSGLRAQMIEASRVINMQGQPLELEMISELTYQLMRTRSDGGHVVDLFMPERLCKELDAVIKSYYTATYGTQEVIKTFAEEGEASVDGLVELRWSRYEMPRDGMALAVMQLETQGEAIWAIDWSQVSVGLSDGSCDFGDLKRHLLIENVASIVATNP